MIVGLLEPETAGESANVLFGSILQLWTVSQTADVASWNSLRTTLQGYFMYKEVVLQSKSMIVQLSSIVQKLMYPPKKEKVR